MSMFSQVQYLNDGGLVSFQQQVTSSSRIGVFGGHQIANSAKPRQDVSHVLGRMPKCQVEPREEPIYHIYIMTLESSSEQTRRHTVCSGTAVGTGPLRRGSKLAFFGSHLETALMIDVDVFSARLLFDASPIPE